MEDVNPEVLRKQLMVNQFCNQVGCSPDQATKILQAARWQLEVAYSLFFQDHSLVSQHAQAYGGGAQTHLSASNASSGGNSYGSRMSYTTMVPTNTPATPPMLPDTLAAFAQMKTSSSPDQQHHVVAGFTVTDQPRVIHVQGSSSK